MTGNFVTLSTPVTEYANIIFCIKVYQNNNDVTQRVKPIFVVGQKRGWLELCAQWRIQDLKKEGGARVLGACPQDFFGKF